MPAAAPARTIPKAPRPAPPPARLLPVLVALAVALPAALHLATLADVFASRATYPMDLEWMEGGELVHAQRLLDRLPIYGPPTQGFLPYPYPPVHFALLAGLGRVFGLSYGVGRALSIASFAAVVAMGAWAAAGAFSFSSSRAGAPRLPRVPRRAAQLAAGALAAGWMAAAFPVVGAWFDLVRIDVVAMAFVFAAAVLLGDGRVGRGRLVAAAFASALAVYTKQTTVFACAWFALYALWRGGRRGVLFVAVAAGLGLTALVALELATRGWFLIWTTQVMAKHPIARERVPQGARVVLEFAPFALAVPALAAAALARRKLAPETALWLGLAAIMLPASLMSYAKWGGFDNTLIPYVLTLPVAAVRVAADAARALGTTPRRGQALAGLAAAGLAVLLHARRFDPAPHRVTARDRASAEAFRATLAGLEGGVLVPNHPFVAVLAGVETPQIHEMPIQDGLNGGVRMRLHEFLDSAKPEWIVLTGIEHPYTRGVVRERYDVARGIAAPSTKIGLISTPRTLVRRRPAVERANARRVFDFDAIKLTPAHGWAVEGAAFESPLEGKKPGRIVVTRKHALGDAATGRATSPEFVLDRARLEVRVGGGPRRSTRVELVIDGKRVHQASGVESDALVPVTWDVSAHRGKTARLVLVDEDTRPYGHLRVGVIELFD